MRTIYLDSDYKCHVTNEAGEYTSVDTDFFDDKCDQLIEGYRLVPKNCEWTDSDGQVFKGLMIAPWKPWAELNNAQIDYELGKIAEYSDVLSEIEAIIKPADIVAIPTEFANARRQAIVTRINELLMALDTSDATSNEE